MQSDEVELTTPNVLESTSLMTPNLDFHFSTPTITPTTTAAATYNPLHNQTEHLAVSNLTAAAAASETSSADVKVLKIEDELKQSLSEPRKPTPSPFQKISANGGFSLENRSNPVVTTEDGTTVEIPSTADVVKEIEAITNTSSNPFQVKTLITELAERETIMNGDGVRFDPSQNSNKVPTVSPPKKNFLIRSQSHTEPTSPIPSSNQSQKLNENNLLNSHNGLDDDNSMEQQFARINDLSTITHANEFKPIIDNGNEQVIKQQPALPHHLMVPNKRPFATSAVPLTKSATVIIPAPSINEVTSTDQLPNAKRVRAHHTMPTNPPVLNFRPNTTTAPAYPSNTNGSNANSDDQRKKQIRDSNREAARRCRERRRQYIEQLEGNLEHHKLQIKTLQEKLGRIERENTQLRGILSESKILHTTRLTINDPHLDYGNVLNPSTMEMSTDSNHQTDGATIQRNYLNRNSL